MAERWLDVVRESYDTDADAYADQVQGLLETNPYLRAGLGLFAELVDEAGGGPVADIGCGPGYVTRHLRSLGADAFGIDLSPEMVAIARQDHPEIRFEVGTMTELDLAEGSLGGVLAFWSIIHLPDDEVPRVFAEFRRVLRPTCPLLVGFHVGDEIRHRTQGYSGRQIDSTSYRRPPTKVAQWLRDAGFTMTAELVMRPDEEVPGAILIATNPA